MAYVPDYIRPVGPKSPPSLSLSPTESNHTRRISSLTGNANSPSSNGRERPSSQLSEDSNSSSPSRRRSSSTPAHTPTRFFKPPQERVCSRVSIKDRLKSLESEAAVKLEIRQTAQRVKRRSTAFGPSRLSQANASPDKDRQSEDNSSISSISSIKSNREQTEKLGDSSFSMPKPDIISSNQPKSTTEMQLPQNQSDLITGKPSEQKDPNFISPIANGKTPHEVKPPVKHADPAELPAVNMPPKPDVATSGIEGEFPVEEDNSLNRSTANQKTSRRTSEPVAPYCISRENVEEPVQPKLAANNFSDANPSDEKPKMDKLRTKSSENLASSGSNVKEKNSAATGFRPIWRTPSLKQADKTKRERLSSYVEDEDEDKMPEKSDEKPTSLRLEEKESSTQPVPQVTPVLDKAQEPCGAAQELIEQKITPLEEKEGNVSQPVTEPTTIEQKSTTTQSATNTTLYPVELRSPRHEHSGQAFRRQDTRDKRNARVFLVPSSSDSDMDNSNSQLFRMERDFAKLGLTRAVDLLPDSAKVTVMEEASHKPQKTPELTLKHVTPVKFVPNVLKVKDSREEKKESSTNNSSKIYPELLAPPRGSRRDSKNNDGDLKKDNHKSPNRRRKSTRSSRSNASRSKSTDARRAGHDVQRHRSNSMCDPKRMRHGQEAVANAVIFGHHPDTTIPYIDDASSPIEESTADDKRSKSRRLSATSDLRAGEFGGTIHRSNSADVLSSVAPEVSPAKLRRGRAASVDRAAARGGVHRRSYQIATMARDSDLEHQKKIEKLSKFLQQTDQDGGGSRDSSLGDQDAVIRSGYLHFKVATIDKGKRTSSQKSWKQVWASLKDQQLCLTKDWSKTKSIQDSPLERQLSAQDEIQSLNVQSSLVGIAYNYQKRRNVFKLTTFNGSEYLFQAENRGDMLDWIASIQKQSYVWEDGNEGISEDLILRKTSQLDAVPKSDKRSMRKRSPKPSHKNNLQVKDVDGSRRFKWRGSVNKIVKKFGTGQPFALNGTFGVHLEDCPPSQSNEFVPFIVELCCRIVEDRGLHFTGIYRVPGNSAALSALQGDLNTHGVESIQPDDERLRDLNVVSSLLKSFFRKLPEPLFTNELYHDFIQGNRQPTPESRLNSLRKLVHMLPGPHYETLKFLISHLRLVADNCESNKMEVRNLAIVFGPTLVRNTAADNTATMVTDMSDQCRIIESIIDHAEWFFNDNSDSPPVSCLTSKELDKEHEAVPSIEFLLGNVGRKPGDNGTTESGKSKGSDDSENSFSRDLMDLIFGKKWKSMNSNYQPVAEDDDGGFEEYRSRKLDEMAQKKDEAVPSVSTSEPVKIPQATQPMAIPNVSERLLNFCQERLERFSQTTYGQTLPTFSSADSSPRTTPRQSTLLDMPVVVTRQEVQPHVGNRARVGSDTQDPRYFPTSSEMPPKLSLSDAVSLSLSAPQYKHPPNPYQSNVGSFYPEPAVSEEVPSSLPVESHRKSASVPVTRRAIPKNFPRRGSQSPQKHTSPKVSSRKSSQLDNIPYMDDHLLNYPQIEPIVPKKEMLVSLPIDENHPPTTVNERLVDELPKPFYSTSPVSNRSRKSSSVSPEPSASKSKPVTRGHSKKASTGSINLPSERPIQKRRKSPLKENFSVPLTTSAATSDKLFSRYDPKRRGIRFAGTENDQTTSNQNVSNAVSPKKKQLTATERLFNGQPLRRKPSSRDNHRSKVIRRHTLSGIQDLEHRSPSLQFKSNLQQANKGQHLSMYDLASVNGNRSAMERLNPRGASSGMTLNNWIVQERLRNKTVQSNGSTGSSIRRRKDIKGQFHSYV